MTLNFPRDLLRILYLIFFRPISLYTWIDQIDPPAGTLANLVVNSYDRMARSYRNLALFHILVTPWLLGAGTVLFVSLLGMEVSWSGLALYLIVVIALSATFSVIFSIAFLLPFSIVVAIWSTGSFALAPGILFSLMIGLAYGLTSHSARWGLAAGLIYGLVFALILHPLAGFAIGAAYLIGYFRIVFYLLEAPLSWILGRLARRQDALKLWRFHPVLWDELIWFPLPGLDRHLQAIQKQNMLAAQEAIHHVKNSFRQAWAADLVG